MPISRYQARLSRKRHMMPDLPQPDRIKGLKKYKKTVRVTSYDRRIERDEISISVYMA
ncbi:MAG: hypothetical protein ACUVQ6_01995 [Dissulfurimicrobium sp.]|uniref:hypothetical protein n=1 Tax=Dissulfurimicrobium sp. TaxID=2022436 RepID=UPI004049F9E5